jgi:hypothetical protein
MSKIFLIDLESVSTRYTIEWKWSLPEQLRRQGHDVEVIAGPEDIPRATTPGAFLNFGGTNIYKSHQVATISRLFCEGRITSGDHFIFTDAWHPGIINLKYMSELLQTPVKIHALWHAGSYDPQDFLGRLIGDAPWVRHAEKSFFHAIDHNYFATNFHIEMFVRNLLNNDMATENPWFEEDLQDIQDGKFPKITHSGWPMEYMETMLLPYKGLAKRDLILFPHRIAPEKQVEIFKDLATHLPQYEFVVCQEQNLTKHQYHTLLGEAKMVFSANLQETLGISCYEGVVLDAIPFVPDRLSYTEMYFDTFKYPSVCTESYEYYLTHRQKLCYAIIQHMDNYSTRLKLLQQQKEQLSERFFSAQPLYNNLK